MVRFKHRYLVLEVQWADGLVDEQLPHGFVLNAIRDSILTMFGDFGVAGAGRAIDVKYWNATTSLAIIRCARSHYRIVWAAASFVTKIGQRQCALCARHIGGTIRSCQRAIVRYDRKLLSNAKDIPVFTEGDSDDEGEEGDGDDDESSEESKKPEPLGEFVAI